MNKDRRTRLLFALREALEGQAFGLDAFNRLDGAQRLALALDLQDLMDDEPQIAPESGAAARVLLQRIGGAQGIETYARCLVVGHVRKNDPRFTVHANPGA